MVIQIIGIIAAVIGFFTNLAWLLIIGGFICLAMDLFGFFTGKLNPLFPIVLYVGGFLVVGNWTGILYGAVLGNFIEIILTFLGVGILSKKK